MHKNKSKRQDYYGTASLDRKNSNLGYTKENCQWIHKHVNFMKRDLQEDEFISFCEKIVEKRKKENVKILTSCC